MATAEQIKSLIRSHLNNQPEQFFTIALQVAAHEAQQGHQSLADVLYYHLPEKAEIKRLIENRLGAFRATSMQLEASVKVAETLSHAEIAQACDDAIKETILTVPAWAHPVQVSKEGV